MPRLASRLTKERQGATDVSVGGFHDHEFVRPRCFELRIWPGYDHLSRSDGIVFEGATRCGGQATGLPSTTLPGGAVEARRSRVARAAPSRCDAEGALDLGGTAPQAAQHRRRHPQKRHKSQCPGCRRPPQLATVKCSRDWIATNDQGAVFVIWVQPVNHEPNTDLVRLRWVWYSVSGLPEPVTPRRLGVARLTEASSRGYPTFAVVTTKGAVSRHPSVRLEMHLKTLAEQRLWNELHCK